LLGQAAKPSGSGFGHVRFFTYLSAAKSKQAKSSMTWQRYNKNLKKSALLAEYFSFWTNLTVFCPLGRSGDGSPVCYK
jgi:hypothetical protein